MGCRKLDIKDFFSFVDQPETPSGRFVKTPQNTYKRSVSWVFNVNDQLISDSSTTKGETAYTYDENGSMTGKVSDSGDSYIYTYNLQNRLSTATISRMEDSPMGGSKLVDITSAYVYNVSGIRVASYTSTKIDDGAAEVKNKVYLTDPANFTGYAQVLEETVNGTLEKTYSIAQEIIAQSSGGTVNYLMRDGHNNTRLLTDNTSSITDRYHFDAYGKETGAKFGIVNSPTTNMLYAGEQYDVGLQNYYNRARYYNPSNGTWNRLDPFSGNTSDPQSLHKYAYCHANPVNCFDPTGRMSLNNMLCAIATVVILHTILGVVLNNVGFESDVKWIPDAGIVGVVGTSQKVIQWLGKFISLLPAKLTSGFFASLTIASRMMRSGLLGITVGAEILFSVASGQMALFLYGGGYFGTNKRGGSPVSASVYSGLVWKLKNSKGYEGNFYSAGAGIGRFGGNAFWGDDGPNGRTHGVTFGRSLLSANTSLGGSWTKYYRIANLNMPSSAFSPYIAGAWGLASSTLVGRIKNPGMLFALTAISSFWAYAKYSRSDNLVARQAWGE